MIIVEPETICFKLFEHDMRRAASRAACTAGNNSAINTPMIAITTSSSTSVNARREKRRMARSSIEVGEGTSLERL